MKTLTKQELLDLGDPSVRDALQRLCDRAHARGDGVAVYENQEINPGKNSNGGHLQFVSCGGPAAQIEVMPPPDKMPDIGGNINYCYYLKGVCLPEAPDA